MKDIPVHQLKDRGSPAGIDVKRFNPGDKPKDLEGLGAHRDDHYMFFVLEENYEGLMIDFSEVSFEKNSVFYILPGQVHHVINSNLACGWFIAVDTMLISADYRNVFETQLKLQQPVVLGQQQIEQCHTLLHILRDKFNEDKQSPFYLPIVHSLLQSFIGLVASCYCQSQNGGTQLSRPLLLAQQFKGLLGQQVRTVKSPSAYASRLNVSESYLNEALKKATGFSVSHWITQEVVMEAKRLLYYSNLNVKQIAHNLGYEDHTYFSRLFKKSENCTPLEFKTQYRK